MKKRPLIVCFIFLLLTFIPSYSAILLDIDDGLSSRQVYSIAKDKTGYMWFLTHEGVDKYNGLTTMHYKLRNGDMEMSTSPELSFIQKDMEGNIIVLSHNGYIYRYSNKKDRFDLMFDFTTIIKRKSQKNASCMMLDSSDRIWISIANELYIFNCRTTTIEQIRTETKCDITAIAEVGHGFFCIATANHLSTVLLRNDRAITISKRTLPKQSGINYLYFHKRSSTLLISTNSRGLFLYQESNKELINIPLEYTNMYINKVIPLGQSRDEVLVATNGAGIHKLNVINGAIETYNDKNISPLNVNTNIIKDIFMDEEQRTWMAIYPYGISVSWDKGSVLKLSTHAKFNSNIIDNQINFIYEDSDKDIWFLTNNGISCYNRLQNSWKNILYNNYRNMDSKNLVFKSICEIAPGKIIVGGYMSGVYYIDKRRYNIKFFPFVEKDGLMPDKYIRYMYKDKDETIWLGGFMYLKRYNLKDKQCKIFRINYPITVIAPKSAEELWIGTYNSLYIFNKKREKLYKVDTSSAIEYITSVCQYNKNTTLIGTNGNGLFIYNGKNNRIKKFSEGNSAINSDYIYQIIPSDNKDIIISTGKGITRLNIKDLLFTNFISEDNQTIGFNPSSGIKASDGEFYIGSGNGVLKFKEEALVPSVYKSKMVFNSLSINYKTVFPDQKDSPLEYNIDNTKHLCLGSDQNTFSIQIASINYSNQSYIHYSWIMEGLYDEWTKPSGNKNISYTNLSPGKYKLRVRSMLTDDYHTLQERVMYITICPPFYFSIYALILYLIIVIIIGYAIMRFRAVKREQKTSKDKIRFFINTAHDIRTPLSLIMTPLGKIAISEQLSQQGMKEVNLAIKNTHTLTELATNLISFEKTELYSTKLNVYEYNLNDYVNGYVQEFIPYAQKKDITIEVINNTDDNLKVLIDKNKIESILRNLISNAIKYTQAMGIISLALSNDSKNWTIQVSDTGIGIPQKDKKNLFKTLFRSDNATNMQISGTGIGLMLTYRLVKNHRGKITVESYENIGTTFKVTFPLKSRKYIITDKNSDKKNVTLPSVQDNNTPSATTHDVKQSTKDMKHILVVEDNPDFRTFLRESLSGSFNVAEASNGLEALSMAKNNNPDLIISDVMMPIMNGNELCQNIKENVDTSHIPVMLLTALADKENIIEGLEKKADMYITKPFEFEFLLASINNIFANRQIIKDSFAKGNFNYVQDENDEGGLDTDQEFLIKATESIRNNISKELNVCTLCGLLNMSRSSLYNKVKVITGHAPNEYIQKIKMEEASKLLRSKKYSVAEVSEMVGFCDTKHFTRIFKEYYNMPPKAYMKQI